MSDKYESILSWIIEKNPDIDRASVTPETKILEERILSSLDLVELINYLEELKGSELNQEVIIPENFESIGKIIEKLF